MTDTPPAPQPGPESVDARLDQLSERARGLGARTPTGGDRWLLHAGGVVLPLGLVLILLGWYGTAQTPLPFEQTPYVVSGGILGLALVFTGGLLYFSYWLTRLVREGREERLSTQAHQARLERAVVALTERLEAAAAPAAPDDQALVVTAAGTMLHRPDCAATEGQKVRKDGADSRGLALCGLCRPEQPARARPRARRSAAS